ncbi:carbon-nitrogen hydrolase family protein [Exilibacterium tricleocarpae]|uniref:Carbon-nitrogen hydrolase family protein n=1 Tax=Exilibacterium tricleocarpae TaxID=2591008 RepID=A0A545TSH2_9GAMM|nr:carbon-nitrogen hydrolase family protein [Exilibacterium tricleocarpae]TQV80165.1 carbon-nitrogen hydrolase family protein [Exilibacterium tricleocarpae]
MRIAALQMVSTPVLADNLAVAERLLAEAADGGAELAVLPENFAVFGKRDLLSEGEAERHSTGPMRTYLRRCAQRFGLWLVGGTLPTVAPHAGVQPPPQRVFAASFVINAQGEEVGRYDKVHLFDVDVNDGQGRYRESDTFAPGKRPEVVETPWGRLGVAVCYDLRFPEYFRLLVDDGAELIVVPSAFTYVTGKAHWQILMQARAVENLCYMAGACQGGQHDSKRRTWGDSMVVDPWGAVLARRPQGEGVVIADIDFGEVARRRGTMPVHRHRRFSIAPL